MSRDCYCLSHVDVSKPLDAGVYGDPLLRLLPHSSDTVFFDTSDGRPLPRDFFGLPPDGKVCIMAARPGHRQVLKTMVLDPTAGHTKDAEVYLGAKRIGRVDPQLPEADFNPVIVMRHNTVIPWPEEATSEYAAYVREFDEAKADFRRAHKRLCTVLNHNPLEEPPAKRAKTDM